MTDLRKAADMAHEALVMWEQLDPHHSLNVVRAPAINALAEALAQPDEVAAEREACAKVCEEKAARYSERAARPEKVRDINPNVAKIAVQACKRLAAAIRARGEA